MFVSTFGNRRKRGNSKGNTKRVFEIDWIVLESETRIEANFWKYHWIDWKVKSSIKFNLIFFFSFFSQDGFLSWIQCWYTRINQNIQLLFWKYFRYKLKLTFQINKLKLTFKIKYLQQNTRKIFRFSKIIADWMFCILFCRKFIFFPVQCSNLNLLSFSSSFPNELDIGSNQSHELFK